MIDPDLALRIVRESKVMCYDAETDGLHYLANVVGHVISDFGNSVYVPVRHSGGGNVPNVLEFERELRLAMSDRARYGFRTVGHNLAFDQRVARNHGIVLPRPLEDTQINEALIDDVAPSYSLEDTARRHSVSPKLGADLYRHIADAFGGVPDRKQMANFYKLSGDDPIAVDYACGDGITTLELWQSQQEYLERLGLLEVHALECKLIPYLAKMRAKGLRIDMDLDIAGNLDKQIELQLKEFPAGLNVNSPNELFKYFTSLGYDNIDRTPTGKPSFTESWLVGNEHGQRVLSIRRLRKARDAFVAPLYETHNYNGRVHPQLNQTKGDEYGAVGGRLSCSDPNLQAFPKRNKDVGRVVRRAVIPDEGKTLRERDFKQQEPRLYAHYSEDEKLLAGYSIQPNVDMHDIAMRYTGQDRDGAKRLGLGILACMGTKELARRLGTDLATAKSKQSAFLNEAFPSIRQFQRDAETTMRSRGYVKTILGRRAQVLDKRFAYRGVSRIIQGSGGDHIKTAIVDACEYAESMEQGDYSPVDILMTIHDSVIDQIEDGRDDISNEVTRILENAAPKLGVMVPIPVDVGAGKNWAEASYGK